MEHKIPLYLLKFNPILKEKVWGGTKLNKLFQKQGKGNIGESWELTGVSQNVSIVENGALRNKDLIELIRMYQGALVGQKVYDLFGENFPLLFKFIDAREDLSVQLHPDDRLASERHRSFGKTEMWYILQADKNARLILGFNRSMDRQTYSKYLTENRLTEILHSEIVKVNDAFYLAPGTVHAIGGGVLLAEIQQTSDITYRIYDWDRPDVDGTMRELHTELALDAINFDKCSAKIEYENKINQQVLLKSIPYFETNKLELTQNFSRSLNDIDSFVVYMCISGSATLRTSNTSIEIRQGETLLVPACFNDLNFITSAATFLEVYIP